MTRKSDVEILRNLFEEAIEQTSKIYKKVKTLRIPFEEEYTESEIQELTSGKKQITTNWRQAEELMFLIEDCREQAEIVKKDFHPNTDAVLTLFYQTLKNELNQHRKEEFPMKKGMNEEVMVLLDELHELNECLSTFPSYKKSRRLTLKELSIRTLLKLMASMLKDKNIFYSMDVDILLRVSDLLKDISIKRRNKKLTFPFNVTKLFRNMKSKVTKAINARLHLKEEIDYSQLEGEYRPIPVSDLSALKGEFWETFAHLKGVAEKIMNFPQ
ncbi:MAG: hypothetical protein J6S85_06745 [Methanobrevibacter sp.]|nr:hypothetical protein [Methanobrevibacter sp.]